MEFFGGGRSDHRRRSTGLGGPVARDDFDGSFGKAADHCCGPSHLGLSVNVTLLDGENVKDGRASCPLEGRMLQLGLNPVSVPVTSLAPTRRRLGSLVHLRAAGVVIDERSSNGLVL